MNITWTYSIAITRQITEAMKIDTTSKPMNTKIGFNRRYIIHLTTLYLLYGNEDKLNTKSLSNPTFIFAILLGLIKQR